MAEKNFAVTVIIPMYNAEKFIGECLTSLAKQTFQNFEIIIVDDCSTDNSLNFALRFSEIFGGRLRVAKLSENSGSPGIPRNFALEAARGRYVYFLDGDDFLTETALEKLYDVAKKFDADVVHSEKCFTIRYANGEKIVRTASTQNGKFVTEPTLETFDIAQRMTDFTQMRYLWWACNKLFRLKLLRENKITFPAIKCWEDFVFAFEALVTAKNYVRVPFISYCYRIRENSLAHKDRDIIELLEIIIGLVGALDRFMDGRKFFHDNPKYRYEVLDFFLQKKLEIVAKNFSVVNNFSPAEVFDFFREKVFSAKSGVNAALAAYLFVAYSKLKLEVEN